MTGPRPNDRPDVVELWLAEVIANPLAESEVTEFRSSSDSNHNTYDVGARRQQCARGG